MINVSKLGAALAVMLAAVVLGGCSAAQDDYGNQYERWATGFQPRQADRMEKAVQCLTDHGFPGTTILSDGTTRSPNLPDDQYDAYNDAVMACNKEICPLCGQPVSQSRWRWLYKMQLAERDCLTKHGFTISDPPSIQAYLDAPDQKKWSPANEAAQQPKQGGSGTAEQYCPDPFKGLFFADD